MPIFIFTKERRKKLIKLKDTYEKIFETVWHNYTCGDVELNLLHFWALERKGWVYDHFFGEAEDPEDCIVVGNIFDNPQLKKKYGKDWEEEHK